MSHPPTGGFTAGTYAALAQFARCCDVSVY